MALGQPDIVTPAERASRAMQRWAGASTVKPQEQPLRRHDSRDTAAGEQDDEARRLAEENARQKVAAARERKAAAEWRLATAQEAAAAEERRLRDLEQASSDVDTAHSRLMAATEAAHLKVLAEERHVKQAEQRAAAARTSSSAAAEPEP